MFDSPQTNALAGRSIRPSLNSCLSVFVIAVAVLPLSLFAFSLMGRQFFLAELMNNFRCQLMFLLLPFVLLLLFLRQWWLTLLFSVATAWSMIGIVWIYFPDAQPPVGSQPIQIMSFNVLEKNPQPILALKAIEAQDADIVLVVEYASKMIDVLKPLEKRYPYHVLEPRWHGFGIALFSKYPLSDTEIVPLFGERVDGPMLVTRVTVGDQKIRLVGVHLLSPTSVTRLEFRNEQMKEAAAYLIASDEPTIVMGDFNCTPWSPFLSDFLEATGYRDSRQGFGFQATWHKDLGLFKIPIDHALISDQVHVHDRFVGQPGGSDHLPIVFTVSVGESRSGKVADELRHSDDAPFARK